MKGVSTVAVCSNHGGWMTTTISGYGVARAWASVSTLAVPSSFTRSADAAPGFALPERMLSIAVVMPANIFLNSPYCHIGGR